MRGSGCSRGFARGGRCASRLPHCVHTRERPPSHPPFFPRPRAPFVVGPGRAGRGARHPPGRPRREGRSPSGAPTPRRSLRQTWKNCGRSLPSATVWVAPSPLPPSRQRGRWRDAEGSLRPSVPSPDLRGGRAPGARAAGWRGVCVWGTPPGDSASDVGGSGLVWGVRGLPIWDLGRAFPLRFLSASLIAVGYSRFGDTLASRRRAPSWARPRPPVLGSRVNLSGWLAGGFVPGSRDPASPACPATSIPPPRAPPTTCSAAWVRVFRLLAPTEPELVGGSVNETCWGEVILWLRERPGDAPGARAAQTRQLESSGSSEGRVKTLDFHQPLCVLPKNWSLEGKHFCRDLKTRFRYVVGLLFYCGWSTNSTSGFFYSHRNEHISRNTGVEKNSLHTTLTARCIIYREPF